MADDDADDRFPTSVADPEDSPRPDLILLDLNMPRRDGQEALQAIRDDPELKRIPVVVLSISREPEDVDRSYNLGANSYIPKLTGSRGSRIPREEPGADPPGRSGT